MIAEIKHQGYRGPLTNNLFLPAGTYTVGNELNIALRIVPDDLARYLVETGQATVTLEKAEQPPVITFDPLTVEIPPAEETPDVIVDAQALDDAATLAALEEMTVEDLKTLAETMEIDLPPGYMKKADLITLIISQPDEPGK